MHRDDADRARGNFWLDEGGIEIEGIRVGVTEDDLAPAWVMVSVVEIQEWAVVTTSSPGFNPRPRMAT